MHVIMIPNIDLILTLYYIAPVLDSSYNLPIQSGR